MLATDSTAIPRDFHSYVQIYGSLCITALTFILGYIVANLLAKRKERKELKNLREMFLEYQRSFNASRDIQIKNYVDLKNSILNSKHFEIVALKNVSFNYDFFDALDKERLYKSLIDTDISLYEFFIKHSHFKKVSQEVSLFYENLMERLRNLNKSSNSMFSNIEDYMGLIYSDKDMFSSIEKEELRRVHMNKNVNPKSALTDLRDDYIRPLLHIIAEKYDGSKGELRELLPLIKELSKGINLIDEFDFVKQDAADYIDKNIEQLTNPIRVNSE